MPIYEYLCEGCAYKFEVKQSIKDEPLATCERCGKPVTRLISSPAIMFKGSGWYVTDYSDKLKPSTGSDAAPATTGEKKEAASPTPAPTPAAPSAAANTTSSSPSPSTTASTTTPSSTK